VAAGFSLNVLQPDMANLGGVALIMIRRAADRRITTFAGIGTWPRRGTGAFPAIPRPTNAPTG
jgi:gamma-glutamyltranspeptidase / glutathione hydrolase